MGNHSKSEINLIKTVHVQPFIRLVQRNNVDPVPLLLQAKLPESLVNNPQGFVPEQRVWLFIDIAAHALGMENFGLEAAKSLDIDDLGSFITSLRACPAVFTSLAAFCETVNQESSDANFWVNSDEHSLWFHRGGIKGINFAAKQVEDYTLFLMIKIIRLQLGDHWMPKEIHLKSPSPGPIVNDPLFEYVTFTCGQESSAISLSLVDISLGEGTRLDIRFQSRNSEKQFVEKLLEALALYPNPETIAVEEVSTIVGMSVRTIQRRLKEYQINYQQLQDQLKFQRSLKLMLSSASLAQVAFELGYSDSAHFSRAFQRWTGFPPSKYRRNFLGAASC